MKTNARKIFIWFIKKEYLIRKHSNKQFPSTFLQLSLLYIFLRMLLDSLTCLTQLGIRFMKSIASVYVFELSLIQASVTL